MLKMVAVSDGVDRKTKNNLLKRESGAAERLSYRARIIQRGFHLPLYGWEVGHLDHYQYLLLMAGCLLITLPLEFLLSARVYRRVAALVFAIIPVVIIFSIWDIVGILQDHWSYSPLFTTGWKLIFGMPIEELVFFIVVPICGLLTYEAVGQVLRLLRRRSKVSQADPGA
jgi:lycopene beta-cyclase